jgi:hypothetical protein
VTDEPDAALTAMTDPVDATLAAYQNGAAEYVGASNRRGPVLAAFLDRLASLMPRHFTYWREPGLRQVLASADWSVISVEHVAGPTEPRLYVLARAAERSA